MRVADLIARKRNGGVLTDAEIHFLIGQFWQDELPDYQMSALAMAIYFNGLDDVELASWTAAMLHSGRILDLSHLSTMKIDKHSTGGVGDKISLPLAPLVASCGVSVPMISGRGLGHTGGTLDKLESIPGFRTDLSTPLFLELVERYGLALGGQTEEICPADKRLYALRDVTATVESIPLISSSIMSKKLAEGIDGLVLDVKVGSGAFMSNAADATILADTMISIGEKMGKKVVALLTRMDEPLGVMVGNALEVKESIDILRGQGPADTRALTIALAEEMLQLAGIDPSLAALHLDNGRALEKFAEIVEAQGGDPRVCDDPSLLPSSSGKVAVTANEAGTIVAMDTRAIGLASIALGAGRNQKTDPIDPAVGIEMATAIGDQVSKGDVLCWLHHNGRGVESANQSMLSAIEVGDLEVGDRPLILKRRSA